MIIEIDFSSDSPIYMQLRNQIVNLILNGQIKADSSLPSVRRLAADLGINHMTVAKAYRLLKDDGFIEIDRRIGAKVINQADIKAILTKELDSDINALLAKAQQLAISKAELIQLIKERMA